MDATRDVTSQNGAKRGFSWKRLLPLVVLAVGAGLFFGFGLDDYLSLETLRDNRMDLVAWVDANTAIAVLSFVVLYALTIVFLPPSGTLMTVTGGFIFSAVFGTFIVVFGATLGATALFLAAKYALGDVLRARAGPALRKMEAGFRENEMSYMLVLRLIPLFPFWLVNIAPAFLGVSLRTYVIGTFFGIIPGTAVYATFGAGIGSILDSDQELTLAGVLKPEIIAGLIGLALLALVPVVYKKYKKRTA